MKKIFLCVSLVLFTISCGRNPYLNVDIRKITGIEVDNREVSAEISERSIDFNIINQGDIVSKEVKIYNNGSFDINSMDMIEHKMLSADLSNCQKLAVRMTCLGVITFNSAAVEAGIYKELIDIKLNNTDGYLQFEYKIEVLSDVEPNGSLGFNYLNDKTINLDKVFRKNKYKKLISIDSDNNLIRINKLKSTDSKQVNLSYVNVNGNCSSKFSQACFVELTIAPRKLGRFKEQVSIHYTDLTNNTNHILKLRVVAKVAKRKDCFEYSEKSYNPMEANELSQYELSLAFPYFNKVANSTAVLQSILNTSYTQEADIYGEILKFNQDTQVHFSYRLDARDEGAVSGKLIMNLLKYEDVKNDNVDTEILCNLDVKRCSGKRFKNREFKKLINTDFKMNNDKFSKVLTHNQKEWKFFQHDAEFELNEYLGLKKEDIQKSIASESMSFIVADDVKLEKSPILILTRKEKIKCK